MIAAQMRPRAACARGLEESPIHTQIHTQRSHGITTHAHLFEDSRRREDAWGTAGMRATVLG